MFSQCTPVVSDNQRYLELIFVAENLVKEKFYFPAKTILEQAIANYPKLPDAYIALGKVLEQIANDDDNKSAALRTEAIAHYTKALKIMPKCSNVFLKRGMLYRKLNDNTAADNDFNSAKELITTEKVWRQRMYYPHLLKYTEYHYQHLGSAETLSLNQETFAGVNAEAAFLGYIASEENACELALYYFEKAMQASPLDFYSSIYFHHLNYFYGHHKESLNHLALLAEQYHYPLAHWFLAMGYLATPGQEELACQHLKIYVETADFIEIFYFSDSSKSLDLTFSFLLSLPLLDVTKAVDAPNQLMVTNKLDAQVKKLNKIYKAGRYTEVLEICNQAIPLNPKSAELLSLRGHANCELRNFAEAKRDISLCLLVMNKANKQQVSGLVLARALTQLQTNNLFFAKSDYKDACEIAQHQPDLLHVTRLEFFKTSFSLGEKAYDRGDFNLALAYFELANIDNVQAGDCLLAIGKTLKQLTRYQEALNNLERANDLMPTNTKVIPIINETLQLHKQSVKEKNAQTRADNIAHCDGKIVLDSKSEDGYSIVPLTATASVIHTDKKIKKPKNKNRTPKPSLTKPKVKKEMTKIVVPAPEFFADDQAIAGIMAEEAAAAENAKKEIENAKRERRLKQKELARAKRQIFLAQRNKAEESKNPLEDVEQETKKAASPKAIPELFPNSIWNKDHLRLVKMIPDEIYLPLLPEEKTILLKLEEKAKALNKPYRSYICGGSIWDRLRQEFLNEPMDWSKNDCDIITEIPCADLCDLFQTQPSESVHGLISFQVPRRNSPFPLKFDIMHTNDLRDLRTDAVKRDYLPCYLDATGKLIDIFNSLMHILRAQLVPTRPLQSFFADEPLIILRTIHQQVKRNFKVPKRLRQQMEMDNHLLLDSPLLSIQTVNNKLKELFSKHNAVKTFKALLQHKLIHVLYRNIETELYAQKDALLKALAEVALDGRPALEKIYCLFMVAALQEREKGSFEPSNLFFKTKSLIKESSLFSQCFHDVSDGNIRFYLEKACGILKTISSEVTDCHVAYTMT